MINDHLINFNEIIIAERENEINQIEQEIHDINFIFNELNQILQEQNNNIDHIETQIQSTSNNTHQAVIELQQASQYGKWYKGLLFGIGGFFIGGPVFGLVTGIKSSLTITGISLCSGYLSYKIGRF